MKAKLLIGMGSVVAAALVAAVWLTGQREAVSDEIVDAVQASSAAIDTPEPIVVAQADVVTPAIETGPDQPAKPERETRFALGKHYQRLTPTQPTSSSPDQVEVAEVFWYGCNHCYNFDPYVENWVSKKPDGVNFIRIPAVWNPLVRLHARAFYTADALGKGEEMHAPFFREIHVNGNPLSSEAALRDFFARFGVEADEFKSAFDSFAVHTKLQRAETLARRYRVSSVPMVVVNGKYTTNATMTGGYDQLLEVIDELVVLESEAS